MTSRPTIAILVTLDTKEAEGHYLKQRVEAHGGRGLLVDLSMRRYSPRLGRPDISNEEVARAAGHSMDQVTAMDRARAQEAMARGAAAVLRGLLERGELDGVVGLGGSTGLSLCVMAMRGLPLFLPKYMVTTVVTEAGRLIGGSDIAVVWSISDMGGGEEVNAIEAEVLNRVAAAVVAAASPRPHQVKRRPTILASQFGNTTPHLIEAKDYLSRQGYDVVPFHALGLTGGYAMERLVESGMASGVLDLTTHELVDEVAGGVLNATFGDKARLTAAARLGVPQVVLPGAVDMINFWGPETVPPRLRDRCVHEHSRGLVTLVRATGEELYQVGRLMAERLNGARGPTLVIFPLRGFSIIDNDVNAKPRPGAYCQRLVEEDGKLAFKPTERPWFDPQADLQLLKALLEHLDLQNPNIDLAVLDYNINDREVALFAAKSLDMMIRRQWKKGAYPMDAIDPSRLVRDPHRLI